MHLLPERLQSRLLLLLLATLLAAQAVSLLLLGDERRAALLAARRNELVERTATVAELLLQLPEEVQAPVLAAASSPDLVFVLDGVPYARQADGEKIALGEELAERLGLSEDWVEARVVARRPPLSLWDPGALWAALTETGPRLQRPGEDEAADDLLADWSDPFAFLAPDRIEAGRLLAASDYALVVSLPLDSDHWLNAVLAVERLPPLLALQALLVTLLAGGGIGLVAVLVLRGLTRPLAELAEAAEHLGRGRPVPALRARGALEIRRLVETFERMRARIERLLADRAQILAAIGHDLRTPIATLRLRAEFVEDEELRARMLESLAEMERTVEAALAFLRAENASEPLRPTDLAALVESLVEDYAAAGAEVRVVAAESIVLPLRLDAIRRILRNLLDNALRYGKRARIRIETGPREVRIAVEDDGPGIPPEMLEKVFEPFVRVESSRSRETGGAGLGLAIARTIARAQGGDLRLENRPEGGLRACLVLPR